MGRRTLAQAWGFEPEPITELRPVVVGWRIVCQTCGQRFDAKRKHARTCSGRCREKARRDREKAQAPARPDDT